ncbi:MAG: ribonuclease Z [Deltaproteobacteria bacterium]
MSVRELTVLGTASQVPTRHRNHNGYLLRWDDFGILFDPGEGTQRQMAFADLAVSAIDRVCVTHFHGDHCLGLAGILQRLSLDRCAHPVTVHFPESGGEYFARLRDSSIYHAAATIEPAPVPARDGLVVIAETPAYVLYSHALDHSVPTIGYRLEERPGVHFVPERLRAAGVTGPLVSVLRDEGEVTVNGRRVRLDEVSVPREGSVFAFVMDTRTCEGATALARDADLLVMEATFAASEQALATEYGHASSVDAARTALAAGARRLAITHFSQRYSSVDTHLAEARAIFPETIALRDLTRVPIPRRRAHVEPPAR